MSTSSLAVDFEWADYQYTVVEELEAGDSDVVVLRTGYGGGKSYTGAQWVHLGSMQLQSGESLVLAPDFQKGGPATYRVFFETLPGENTVPNDAGGDPENSPIVAGYNQNQKRVTYVSGHVVRLGSADKWNRYAGSEFHRIWMDEPSHYDTTNLYDLHEMLISRQRTQAGPNTCLMTSTGNGYDQFYDITERQVTADDEPLPWADAMRVFVHSSLRNPFLSDDAKQKLRRQFEGTGREAQALHGGFAAAEGLVYSRFSREHHIKPYDAIAGRLDDWRMYCYDAGWDDPRVLLEVARTDRDQYAVVDLLYESGCHVGDPANPAPGTALAWLEDRSDGVIYSEHTPADIDKFRRAGWDARKAEKDIDGGIDAVRERLKLDDEGRPGLLVADRCTPLIQEFLSYQEEHVGKSQAEDHALDALRYGIFTNSVRTEHNTDSGGFARSF